jgi:hypothetical protein
VKDFQSRGHGVERLLFFAGVLMLGFLVGGWLYVAVTGHRYSNIPLGGQRDWSAAPFLAINALLILFAPNAAIRSAFIIGAFGQMVSLTTPIGGAGLWAWAMRELIEVVMAALLVWGGRRAVTRRDLRVLAALIFIVAIPVRYWTIKQWHDIVNPPSVMQGS